MLTSLALVLLCGFLLRGLFMKLRLPGLLGMLLCGMLLGPYALDWIAPEIMAISGELREIALIVILLRAGLALDLKDLRQVGRPALLMCFLPAILEILAVILLAPVLLGYSYLEAAVLATLLAAVSPAVIVPHMLTLMQAGYGQKNRIPQLIMAAASVDDVWVIVLFTAFLSLQQGDTLTAGTFISVPVAILLGLAGGFAFGRMMAVLWMRIHMRDTVKVFILLAIAFLLVGMQPQIHQLFPFSSLIAVMAFGMGILKQQDVLARRIAGKFSKIWVAAELILFVLLGAIVEFSALGSLAFSLAFILGAGLLARSIGVILSLLRTGFPLREKAFCLIAFWPKATVQAALGALPLAAGMAAGHQMLAAAALAIMIAAPLGSIGLSLFSTHLLQKTGTNSKE